MKPTVSHSQPGLLGKFRKKRKPKVRVLVDRPANRAERRDSVRQMPRRTRLAYGFGAWRWAPPGVFLKPARSLDEQKRDAERAGVR